MFISTNAHLTKALHLHLHRAVTIANYMHVPVCALVFFKFTTEKQKTNTQLLARWRKVNTILKTSYEILYVY